ncbi:Low-density lipoprotein receptor [Anthophora retusa]
MGLPAARFFVIVLLLFTVAETSLGRTVRSYWNRACTSTQFRCRNNKCINSSALCDGYNDCLDGSDEQNCHECRPDEFRCSNGDCVSQYARCDGRSDCRDRSDEYNCNVTTCSSDQFRCQDGSCISIDRRCNMNIDCRNGEDETQCGEYASLFLSDQNEKKKKKKRRKEQIGKEISVLL